MDGFPAFKDKRQKIFRELLPCAHERMTAPIAPADVPRIVTADLCPELVKGRERHDGVVVAGGEKHLPVRKRRGGVRKTHGGGMGADVVHDRTVRLALEDFKTFADQKGCQIFLRLLGRHVTNVTRSDEHDAAHAVEPGGCVDDAVTAHRMSDEISC